MGNCCRINIVVAFQLMNLKTAFDQRGSSDAPFVRPHFMYYDFFLCSLHNMDVLLRPSLFTIKPVHSGGRHGNRAASLSPSFVRSLPTVCASYAEGVLDLACKYPAVIEFLIEIQMGCIVDECVIRRLSRVEDMW